LQISGELQCLQKKDDKASDGRANGAIMVTDEASQETRRTGVKATVVRASVGAPETAKNSERCDNNIIRLPTKSIALLAISFAFGGAKVAAQSLGNLAQYPPLPKQLTITT
jgi:hypothetical protein